MNRVPRVLIVALSLAAVPLSVRSQNASAACSPPMNAIACENANPGTPQSTWDISGSGDAAIQGYATDISVNVGTTVHFKVMTPASAYHMDIYRIGYYAGNGARLITTIRPTATLPQIQPGYIVQASTALVDCGNWAESASWAVPATPSRASISRN